MEGYCFWRLLVLFFLSLCSVHGFADDLTISTKTQEGKTLFFVNAGSFPTPSSAQELQSQLSASLSNPIHIKHNDIKNTYSVQIGPLAEYSMARDLKNTLSTQNHVEPLPQAAPTPPTTPAVEPPKESSKGQVWNLRNADIRAVIAEVSRISGKNFVIDPRVQGKVSMISSTPLSPFALYQVFLSVLQVSGFAAVPSGDIIKIIPNMDAKSDSPDLLSQMKNPPRGDAMMVAVMPVHYVPAEQLVPVLRPLMPQWSSISAYSPSNMIILSGRANNIKSMAHIIKQVDSSSASDIDIVPLKFTLAMDIANTLKELTKSQNPNMGRPSIMIAPDDRSNTILVGGSRTDRIRIRLLIDKLDRHNRAQNATTQVVYLHYLRAEDLVPILAGIAKANFSGTVGTTIGTVTKPELDSSNPAAAMANVSTPSNASGNIPPPPTNPSATPQTTTAAAEDGGSTKPTVQIIAEPNTNSIILNAPLTLIHILQAVITQLDIQPEQLLIEALVVEVNESDANNLGIEWGSNQQTGDPGKFRPGFAIINSKTTVSDFQAQIYALAKDHRANILSTPSVVVLDNRQAKILVGKQVSVGTTTYPNNAGGTAAGSPYLTFERVNVALHLYVRPQITHDRGIQLQIDQGNDTIDPISVASSTTNPTFNISSIVTSVHIDSGDVVVLGGLAQDGLSTDDTRLPILGDIPGIGRLFQNKQKIREKKVLMVFIKPVILDSKRHTMAVTASKYNPLREYQLAWLRSQRYFEKNSDVVMPQLSPPPALPRPFVTHPTGKPKVARQ